VELSQNPQKNVSVFAFQSFRESLNDLSEIDESSTQRLLDEFQVGEFKQHFVKIAVIERHSFVVMDGPDAQLIQSMSVVLLPPNSVLFGVVPVEMTIGDIFRNIVRIRLGGCPDDTSSGQSWIFDEIWSGLSCRLGSAEDHFEEKIAIRGDFGEHDSYHNN
jgi:hypothetical protein